MGKSVRRWPYDPAEAISVNHLFEIGACADGVEGFIDRSGLDDRTAVGPELLLRLAPTNLHVRLVTGRSNNGDGYGYGSNNGNGYGYGDGYGDGDGSGNGNGYGDSYGDGYGYGDGDGSGNGNGDGNGYGDDYGYGDGDGATCGYQED